MDVTAEPTKHGEVRILLCQELAQGPLRVQLIEDDEVDVLSHGADLAGALLPDLLDLVVLAE